MWTIELSNNSYTTLKCQDLGKPCIMVLMVIKTNSIYSCYGGLLRTWWGQLVLWPNHKVQATAKAVGPNSSGQSCLDLTRRGGQEKYHQTILFTLDLSSNILTILVPLIRKS